MALEERPDSIIVSVVHEDELAATYADLRVTVKGSSFFTGGAARTKAREVASLVQGLGAVGVPEAAIHVEDVAVQVESGKLTKSSSATYTLRVRCEQLEALGDVLGAITAQKNAQIGNVDWGYSEPDALRTRWLVDCAARATARAREIAAALGVQLLGVHRFLEPEVEAIARPFAAGGVPSLARARMTSADLGLSVANSKKIVVRVVAEFRVGGYA